MVGSLVYILRTTRWDISYAVLQLKRATSKPSTHLKKAKHALRYLKGHQELDIVYRSGYFKLQAFADASFAIDPDKRRSTSGYIFLFSGAPISSVSTLQLLTALSTVESELVAITLCMKKACHIQDLLRELKFDGFEKISIGNDSTGALSVVSTNGYSARTKHLQLRKWFCTELIESGRISVHCVPTDIPPADIFTKTTTKAVHRKLVDLIQAYAS